jgi:DNA-binding NtrC family response regulator
MTRLLQVWGHQSATAGDARAALARLREEAYDVVLATMDSPAGDALQLLHTLRQQPPRPPAPAVVFTSARASISLAVRAIRAGAFDFLEQPLDPERLQAVLSEIARPSDRSDCDVPREDIGPPTDELDETVIGTCEAMRQVKRLVRIAAQTDANVLLCGETGVGKDLLASTIHELSHRRRGTFVKVGCTLLPPGLIENELFGHQAGSFTGADQSRPGRFEKAHGGTIYLDDLDDIPLEHQAKLLRAIEEKVLERVGGTEPIHTDVRVIGSTKAQLLEKVADGTFRKDLYYRLDVLRIRVPPLRERDGDLPLLVHHLMRQIAGDEGYAVDDDVLDVLQQHAWPGNIRELHHALERAWLVGAGRLSASVVCDTVLGEDGGGSRHPPEIASEVHGGFRVAMDYAEKQLLLNALDASGGNKTAAARSLSMKPSTFRDKLAKHHLS